MTEVTGTRWLTPWQERPPSRPVLVCLPPAGAGCRQFLRWQPVVGMRVTVVGVQLPGREERWSDPPCASVAEVVDAVALPLSTIPDQVPLVIFGHSFGALLGYEIARRLDQEHDRTASALVVAACRPPHMWARAGRALDDDVESLRRLWAERGVAWAQMDADSQELLLSVLREDARLGWSYEKGSDVPPLRCDIHAWGGACDTTVTAGQLAEWRGYTSAAFQQREFAGGHYFLDDHVNAITAMLAALSGGPL